MFYTMQKEVNMYETPIVEVIEMEVEKGFATSGEDFTPGTGSWGF